MSVADASAAEGDNVVFTVTLSEKAYEAVTLDYATSIGDDDTAKQTDFDGDQWDADYCCG